MKKEAPVQGPEFSPLVRVGSSNSVQLAEAGRGAGRGPGGPPYFIKMKQVMKVMKSDERRFA